MVRSRGALSIKTLVALVVIVPTVVIAAALVWLSSRTSTRIAEGLGQNIMEESARRVSEEVADYLASSVRVSEAYTRRIHSGQLPTSGNLQTWEPMMLDDLATRPHIASICFANVNGDATWLLRHGSRLEVGRSLAGAKDAAVEYEISRDGVLAMEPIRRYTYEPRTRPWYTLAVEKKTPVWTPLYFWFGDSGGDAELGAGYSQPIYDADGKLLGVLVIDTTVGELSDFLRTLSVTRQGYIFVVDRDQQRLVATSSGTVTTAGKRTLIADSKLPAARAMAPLLAPDLLGTHPVTIDGAPARATLVNLEPYPGIHWHGAIVLPESAFLADAWRAQQRSLFLAGLAIAASLVLGYFLASRVTAPLLTLSSHVRKVGQGDFAARLELKAARELQQLSTDLNTMADDLQKHVVLQQSLAVATQVQQSLLPLAAPRFTKLDVYGTVKYCDSTGGDYYDYIDVANIGPHRLMLAIGDVMGHGIAAALLMATARAALRASALHSGALSRLMNSVNVVLTKDNRHGRFMTMLLMLIDSETAEIRWASAGHDAALVYDPQTDAFKELEGGSVPLGVDDTADYEEYLYKGFTPGQILATGTDGIWEARNANDEFFGKERLCQVIRANAAKPAAQIAEAIHAALDAHFAGTPSHDDITFMLVKSV